MSEATVSSGATRLKHAVSALKDRWELTRETWTDAVGGDFERQHIVPLESAVEAAIHGMHELADVLGKIRRDLSDDTEGW